MTLLVLLLAQGCYTPQGYSHQIANGYCVRLQECDKGDFEDEFHDMEDCIDETLEVLEPVAECSMDEKCEFDGEEAAECDEAIRTSDCDDFSDRDYWGDCDDIWDCDAGDRDDVAECIWDETN